MMIRAIALRAVDKARELKADIPLVGETNIPIRDELELERWLAPSATVEGMS
jgi:hypothetical protein